LAAEGYRRVHQDPRIEVVPFLPEWVNPAISLYGKRPDKDWSLTDCLSFIVMNHRDLAAALTTDRHFEQANYTACMLHPPSF
jgi:predicted nucleic acid-binding protein